MCSGVKCAFLCAFCNCTLFKSVCWLCTCMITCALSAWLCIQCIVMLAAGAYRNIERGQCASNLGYKINQHLHKAHGNARLFINTVGFVGFLGLNWITCVFASPLARFALMARCWLIPMSLSGHCGHYQRCNHETAAMGNSVESLSTDFHTFLQMSFDFAWSLWLIQCQILVPLRFMKDFQSFDWNLPHLFPNI